ncbi:F-box protein [Trifolium pratense]|uniref:F-box protein n=1 Tax=Trifolium pratense TaxID=57577 RepID=A0A2K3N4M7_TRIPR|nr:F-box protein [Trifolium pratense]
MMASLAHRFQVFNFNVTVPMDILPIKNQCQSNVPFPQVSIPDELIAEILLFLDVKTIVRFKCVSKSWNIHISNPTFTELHLKKSSQNPHFIVTPFQKYRMRNVVSLPVCRLLENPSITVAGDKCHSLPGGLGYCQVVGSCNGLLCLLYNTISSLQNDYRLCLWNPATRTISDDFGFFVDYEPLSGPFKFSFGCDYLTGTYKVLALHTERNAHKETENEGLWRSKVRVSSFGYNGWRYIQSFPSVPLIWNDGVHLSGTINWLAISGDFVSMSVPEGAHEAHIPHVEQFVIVSVDLSTEAYTQLLLPPGFDAVPCVEPSLRVLMDCLCFSHDFNRTEFVLWQMKEFGVHESWTQLFRIEYVNLQLHNLTITDNTDLFGNMECKIPLLPLYLSNNGDTLILTSDEEKGVIIYNQRDKKVERSRISNKICWQSTFDYVESLVSTLWEDLEEDEEEKEVEDEDDEENGAICY